jgi:hypothetical protein
MSPIILPVKRPFGCIRAVKILLQNGRGEWMTSDGKWTREAGKAHDFPTVDAARDLCKSQQLRETRIIIRGGENQTDVYISC